MSPMQDLTDIVRLALITTICSELLSVTSQRWLLRALILRIWLTFTIAFRGSAGIRVAQTVLNRAQGLGAEQALLGGDNPHQLSLRLECQAFIGVEYNVIRSAAAHHLAALALRGCPSEAMAAI